MVIDIFVGKLVLRLLDGDPFVFWYIKLRTDFEVELVSQWTFVRNVNLFVIEIRFADRRELLVLAYLSQAVHQQRAFDLIANLLAKFRFDQVSRRAALTEPRHFCHGSKLVELLLVVTLDLFTRDRNGNVPLASANLFDVDR